MIHSGYFRIEVIVSLCMGIQMQITYYVMLFKILKGTIRLTWDVTIIVQCMTASIVLLKFILLSQIWIFLPFPYMIYPARTKYTVISLIFCQLPFMLPPKNLIVILSHLVTIQPLIYLFLIFTQWATILWDMELDAKNKKAISKLVMMEWYAKKYI